MKPEPTDKCVMTNVIGKDYENRKNFSKKYKFYDYFKEEVKELRKMGHYTLKG